LYTYGESHPKEKDLLKAKLDGFIEAGLVLKHATKEELQLVIDKTHLEISGMTRAERAAAKDTDNTAFEPDWSGYDVPPLQRNKK